MNRVRKQGPSSLRVTSPPRIEKNRLPKSTFSRNVVVRKRGLDTKNRPGETGKIAGKETCNRKGDGQRGSERASGECEQRRYPVRGEK